MGCWGTAALPWSAPRTAEESLLWHLRYFSDLYVYKVGSLSYTLSCLLWLYLLLCNNFFPFFPFLNILSYISITTIGDELILGQGWVPLGAGWNCLCWTVWKLLPAYHKSHPFSSPAPKTLPCKPSTVFVVDMWRDLFSHCAWVPIHLLLWNFH